MGCICGNQEEPLVQHDTETFAYLLSGSVNIGTGRFIDALLPEELPNELNAVLEEEENT